MLLSSAAFAVLVSVFGDGVVGDHQDQHTPVVGRPREHEITAKLPVRVELTIQIEQIAPGAQIKLGAVSTGSCASLLSANGDGPRVFWFIDFPGLLLAGFPYRGQLTWPVRNVLQFQGRAQPQNRQPDQFIPLEPAADRPPVKQPRTHGHRLSIPRFGGPSSTSSVLPVIGRNRRILRPFWPGARGRFQGQADLVLLPSHDRRSRGHPTAVHPCRASAWCPRAAIPAWSAARCPVRRRSGRRSSCPAQRLARDPALDAG